MKKRLPSILVFGVLPVIVVVLFLILIFADPNFRSDNVLVGVIIAAIVAVLCVVGLIALTVLYERIRTKNEMKEEQAIEERGEFIVNDGKADEDAYEDQVMEEEIKKKHFVLMTREEIIEYCRTLNSYVQTQVLLRTHVNLPDVISAGEKNYCLLHEREGVIKLTVKNDPLYFNALSVKHHRVSQCATTSDWFEIILDDSFYDNQQIKDIIKASYEYVKNINFTYIDGQYIPKEDAVSQKAEKELVVTKVDVDKTFGEIIEHQKKMKKLTLTTRNAIADYAAKNVKGEFEAFVIRREGFRLYSLKASKRSYGMLYERESVVKIWLRLDPEYAEEKMKLYPTMMRAKFPRGKDWYSVVLDGHLDEDEKITELIHAAYSHVCLHYLTKKSILG